MVAGSEQAYQDAFGMKRDVGSIYYEDRGKINLFVSGRAIFVVECLLQPTVVGESLGGDGGSIRKLMSVCSSFI